MYTFLCRCWNCSRSSPRYHWYPLEVLFSTSCASVWDSSAFASSCITKLKYATILFTNHVSKIEASNAAVILISSLLRKHWIGQGIGKTAHILWSPHGLPLLAAQLTTTGSHMPAWLNREIFCKPEWLTGFLFAICAWTLVGYAPASSLPWCSYRLSLGLLQWHVQLILLPLAWVHLCQTSTTGIPLDWALKTCLNEPHAIALNCPSSQKSCCLGHIFNGRTKSVHIFFAGQRRDNLLDIGSRTGGW